MDKQIEEYLNSKDEDIQMIGVSMLAQDGQMIEENMEKIISDDFPRNAFNGLIEAIFMSGNIELLSRLNSAALGTDSTRRLNE